MYQPKCESDVMILSDGTNVTHTLADRTLVLVVSGVCAGRYGTRKPRDGSTGGTERVMG